MINWKVKKQEQIQTRWSWKPVFLRWQVMSLYEKKKRRQLRAWAHLVTGKILGVSAMIDTRIASMISHDLAENQLIWKQYLFQECYFQVTSNFFSNRAKSGHFNTKREAATRIVWFEATEFNRWYKKPTFAEFERWKFQWCP